MMIDTGGEELLRRALEETFSRDSLVASGERKTTQHVASLVWHQLVLMLCVFRLIYQLHPLFYNYKEKIAPDILRDHAMQQCVIVFMGTQTLSKKALATD